jgi:HAD superfamily hydrolase (TIGR01490 family)
MQVAAFFDMDKTLLHCNTGRLWIDYLRRRGELSRMKMLQGLTWLLRYRFALLDFDEISRRLAAEMAGESEGELADKCAQFVADKVLPEVAPLGRERIAHHRAQGHLCVMLSSSSPYVTEPLARELSLDHVLCTRLEVEAGKFTGRVLPPVCFGAGKVHWAEQFADAQKIDLGASWFYTDSYSDLPMLRRVGRQVVINPDPRLRRFARRAGWVVEQW